MTSNKHKKSTPQKPPFKSPPHKPYKTHKHHKTHKSPQEKVVQSKSQTSILPQNHAGDDRPILPPTRRVLFPQSAKLNNKQQPFCSPPAVKEQQKSKKRSLYSPVTKPSDDRPSKKQCLSSPSPAKRTKVMAEEKGGVVGRAGQSTPSDEEDDSTPSPPSRKRRSNGNGSAAGCQKKFEISVVVPMKQHPSLPSSSIQPNSATIKKIDKRGLQPEKEELQKRLDASVQQAGDLKYDAQNREDRYKEESKASNNVDRLELELSRLNTQNKKSSEEKERKEHLEATNRLLAKQIVQLKEEVQHKDELAQEISQLKWKLARKEILLKTIPNTYELEKEVTRWKGDLKKSSDELMRRNTKHKAELAKQSAQFMGELQSCKKELAGKVAWIQEEAKHKDALSNQVAHLQEELEQLQSSTLIKENAKLKRELLVSKTNYNTRERQHREEQLELSNELKDTRQKHLDLETKVTLLEQEFEHWERSELKHAKTQSGSKDRLNKQILQLNEEKNQLITQVAHLQQQLQHKEQLTFQITQLHEDLQFKDDLRSQALRTHAHEKEALNQQITHLQSQLQSQNHLANQVNELTRQIHPLSEELLDKKEEIAIMTEDHEKEIWGLQEQLKGLQSLNQRKDVGLEKMGMLIAGWTMKWQAVGYGLGEGKGRIPGVEGMGFTVNGERMD